MTHYILPGLRFKSDYAFSSFAPFLSEQDCALPVCTLTVRRSLPPDERVLFQSRHADFDVHAFSNGWGYVLGGAPDWALHASLDYRHLTAYVPHSASKLERLMPLVRTALECARIPEGYLSLHSACVSLGGRGVCLTAPSGVGKSTRAMSWQSGLGAQIISGDRPCIALKDGIATVSGAPWDGKEQLFVNQTLPLHAICSIRRGAAPYVRRLSPAQAKALLYRQCFIPMWDTDAAAQSLLLIGRLCERMPIYRVTCGPDEEAARQVKDILFDHPEKIKEAQRDMKIKHGFVLRSLSGEHIVMPTGKNIAEFDGTIVLNDAAAFIWEKLCAGCSRDELLGDILSEFEVEPARAEADLDALLEKLRAYQVLEETV